MMLADPTTDSLASAPFFDDVAEGPGPGQAWWVESADGTRLRFGLWHAEDPRGTILLFPGRTEYVEKYGRVACDLTAAGYTVVVFDWRGQGLSDRPQHRRDMGHVISFDEYREDVRAFRSAMDSMDLPKPHYLIAHSMGGAIGLRALHDGLPVQAAAFSAPMWGIQMTPFLRSIAGIVLGLAGPLGFGTIFAPSTGPWEPMAFEDNPLTKDADQFAYMARQLTAHSDLALGGPSVLWVKAALEETSALLNLKAPDIPTVTVYGDAERIVEVPAIHTRMDSWPDSKLIKIPGGEHEVLMETPERRSVALKTFLDHFAAHS